MSPCLKLLSCQVRIELGVARVRGPRSRDQEVLGFVDLRRVGSCALSRSCAEPGGQRGSAATHPCVRKTLCWVHLGSTPCVRCERTHLTRERAYASDGGRGSSSLTHGPKGRGSLDFTAIKPSHTSLTQWAVVSALAMYACGCAHVGLSMCSRGDPPRGSWTDSSDGSLGVPSLPCCPGTKIRFLVSGW